MLGFADGSELACDLVVNSASLHACGLARRFEGLDARFVPREWFAKGNYYALGGRAPFNHLIYPAPGDAHLGTHLTLDLGGQAYEFTNLVFNEGVTLGSSMLGTIRSRVSGAISLSTRNCGPKRTTSMSRYSSIASISSRSVTKCS